jgi:ankyrin repeat protein
MRKMADSDRELMKLVTAILQGETSQVAQMLAASPGLATARFQTGASRASEKPYFLSQIGKYINSGDSALHMAAAAYQVQIVEQLIGAGADVRARNRFGYNPLHAAAAGSPGSQAWNPAQQAATIRVLVKAGVDPDSTDKRGVTPMHIAVRTRCALAVQTLLECGADPARRNKNGSDAMVLAINTTGRGGSGSLEAKQEQQKILQLLSNAGLSSAGTARAT